MSKPESIGEAAYNAYNVAIPVGPVLFPRYNDISKEERIGWEAAGNAAIDQYESNMRDQLNYLDRLSEEEKRGR